MNLCPEIDLSAHFTPGRRDEFFQTPEVPLNRLDLITGTFLLYMPVGADGQPTVFHNAVRFEAFAVAALPDGGMYRLNQYQMPTNYPDNVWFTHGLVYRNGNFYSAPASLSPLGGIITVLNQHQVSRMSLLDISR